MQTVIEKQEQTAAYVSTLGMSRDEWRQARKRGIGSSDCAAILGLNPYRTPLDVYLDKIGEAPEQPESIKMAFGLEAEPIIARMFEAQTGLTVRNDFKIRVHPEYPFLIANLDRTIVSNNGRGPGILEIKTVSEAFQKTWEDEVPLSYFAQIQHQMMVTGYEYGYFANLFFGFTGVMDFQVIEVMRDNEFIAKMQADLIDFWKNHVEPRIPPEPVNSDDLKKLYPRTAPNKSVEARSEIIEVINRLKEINAALKPLEEEKKDLEEQLKLAFLDAEILISQGVVVATYKQTKDILKFDQKKFEAENPELYQRYATLVPGYRRLIIK